MAGGDGTGRGALAGARVLVTEDQAVVAVDLEATRGELGCVVLGPAASVAEALRLVGPGTLDAAVLNMGLVDGFALPVAEALGAAGVPFALLTGYPEGRLDHPALRAAPRLAKPFDAGELGRVLVRLLGRAGQTPARGRERD